MNVASPVSQSDTSAPAARAVAATVNACEHGSGSVVVHFTTSERPAMPRSVASTRGYDGAVDAIEIFFAALLVLVSLVIVWFAGYAVYKLYKGQA
jgi:hypothetical protein